MSTQAVVNLIFETLWWVILGRVLMSWFDPSGNYRISRILYDMSEPILALIHFGRMNILIIFKLQTMKR